MFGADWGNGWHGCVSNGGKSFLVIWKFEDVRGWRDMLEAKVSRKLVA
jgi:hypothetical protein